MIRFIATSFDSGDAIAEARSGALAQAVAEDPHVDWQLIGGWNGFKIWCSDPATIGVPRPSPTARPSKGFLVGRLFEAGQPRTRARNSGPLEEDLKRLAQFDEMHSFSQLFWGDYLIFLGGPGVVSVSRDPTGLLPCFYRDFAGLRLWFSDIADAVRLFPMSIQIDHKRLAPHLRFPKISKAFSALAEIDTVLPGTTVTHRAHRPSLSKIYWDPGHHVDRSIDSLDAASELLRASVFEVVSAYFTHFPKSIVSIGGLDSSIIWSTARHLGFEEAAGFTLYSDSQSGDERNYVATLTDQHRIRTMKMTGEQIDCDRFLNPDPAASPRGFADLIEMAWDRSADPLLAEAACLIYGVGGDNVLLQGAFELPALDLAISGASLSRVIAASHRSGRQSKRWIGSIFAQAITARFGKDKSDSTAFNYMFKNGDLLCLSDEILALEQQDANLHPVYGHLQSQLPGKAAQILSSCYCSDDYYDPYAEVAPIERCELFFKQPILEACLRIPSWLLAHKGIERGLARLAFADILPTPVLRRMSKGTPEAIYDEFVSAHFERLREFLLDGSLQAAGILDRKQLESLLKIQSDPENEKYFSHPVVQICSWQAWANTWS